MYLLCVLALHKHNPLPHPFGDNNVRIYVGVQGSLHFRTLAKPGPSNQIHPPVQPSSACPTLMLHTPPPSYPLYFSACCDWWCDLLLPHWRGVLAHSGGYRGILPTSSYPILPPHVSSLASSLIYTPPPCLASPCLLHSVLQTFWKKFCQLATRSPGNIGVSDKISSFQIYWEKVLWNWEQ